MAPSSSMFRSILLACAIAGTASADPARIVFTGGPAIPVTAMILQGGNFVVNAEVEGNSIGQSYPFQNADHIYGDKPAELNQGIALLMLDKPKDAIKVLEPVIVQHRLTQKIPGNYWVEAARTALLAYALTGNSIKVSDLGREISDATPAPGIDPFVSLGKALLMPDTLKIEERAVALKDQISEDKPASVCAYAAYFLGNLYKDEKRTAEALEAYLAAPCLYPTGGLLLNAGAEIKAAEQLTALTRREEAVALLKSAQRVSSGTALAEEINKRLESLK